MDTPTKETPTGSIYEPRMSSLDKKPSIQHTVKKIPISLLLKLNKNKTAPVNSPREPEKRKPIREAYNRFRLTVSSAQRESVVKIFENIYQKTYLELENDFELIIALLKKPYNNRTKHEIGLLDGAFQKVKFFEQIKEQMDQTSINNLFKEFTYECAPSNGLVFQIGDVARKFYIIIKGSVHVLLKKKGLEGMDQAEEEKIVEPEQSLSPGKNTKPLVTIQPSSSESRNIALKFLRNMMPGKGAINDDQLLKTFFPNLFKAKTLVAGDSFGELALRDTMPRTATIICAEPTHFAVLSKKSFNKILSAYYNRLNQENLHFLKQVSFFSHWKIGALSQLYYQMQCKILKKGTLLYKEGSEPDFVYFIKDGEVEISRILETVEKPESPKIPRAHMIKKKSPGESVKLARITKGGVFGQEEIISGEIRKSFARVYSAEATLYLLSKDKFNSFVREKKTLLNLDASNKQIDKWRTQHTQELSKWKENFEPKNPLNELDDNLFDSLKVHRRNQSEPQMKKVDQESPLSPDFTRIGSTEKGPSIYSNPMGSHKDERAVNFEKLLNMITEDKHEKLEVFQEILEGKFSGQLYSFMEIPFYAMQIRSKLRERFGPAFKLPPPKLNKTLKPDTSLLNYSSFSNLKSMKHTFIQRNILGRPASLSTSFCQLQSAVKHELESDAIVSSSKKEEIFLDWLTGKTSTEKGDHKLFDK